MSILMEGKMPKQQWPQKIFLTLIGIGVSVLVALALATVCMFR